MPPQLQIDRIDQFTGRAVPVIFEPLVQTFQRCGELPAAGLALKHQFAFPAFTHIVSEAEKVKVTFPFSFLRRFQGYQSCLFGIQVKVVFAQAHGQYFHHSPGVFFMGEPHKKIIGKANQGTVTFQQGLDLLDKPLIQYVMQIDVAEQR